MTSREARTRRREEERKQAKLAYKAEKLAGTPISAPRFNPGLEDEFPRELQAEANLLRDRVHRSIGLDSIASVSESGNSPNPSREPERPIFESGFVSQNRAEINRQNARHSTGPRSPEGNWLRLVIR